MDSTAPSVFSCPSFGSYLAAWVSWRKSADPTFSLRGLAMRARKSPSIVTMIARGERPTTKEVGLNLCKVMGLSASERRYLMALIDREHARSPAAIRECDQKLTSLRPLEADHVIDLDTFELLSQWYHTTIVEMTELRSFRPDPEWIANELGPSVTPAMVSASLDLLQRLGLLELNADGNMRKTHVRLRTTANIPSSAIRSCHKQLIQRAYNAVERQTVDERFLSTLTFPVPMTKQAEARRMIADFRDQFVSTLQSDGGPFDEVYHLNIQFFRATVKQSLAPIVKGATSK